MRIRRLLVLIVLLASNQSVRALDSYQSNGLELLAPINLEKSLARFKSSVQINDEAGLINAGGELGFQDFYTIVKANHPDIIKAEINRKISTTKRKAAQGAFDPSINSKNAFRRFNSTSDIGEAQDTFLSETSLDFLTGYGAKFGVGAKYAVGDLVTGISPTGDTGEYFIKAQIPLLRGAIYNSKYIKEKSAKLNETIADFLLFRSQIKTLDKSTKAYWDWVASKQILDVENNLLNIVNGQVSFVAEQAKLGNLAQISVIEAQRELQKRQFKVNSSTRGLQKDSIELAKFLWSNDGRPYAIPRAKQVPDSYVEPQMIDYESLQIAKLKALSLRPELQALNLSRDISELERKLAKNQILPQFDIYTNSGIETGEDSIGPAFEAGVTLSIPLRVRTAKGKMEEAELKIKKLNLQERQLIQNIFLELEDIVSKLNTSFQKYQASKNNYQLSVKLEEAEKDRFDLGSSTLFLVIRRQRARVEANVELIKTIAEYQKSKIRFKLLQGLI